MVIVQTARKNLKEVEYIKTKDLKPYQANTLDPYITAHFRRVDSRGPMRFVIGDGKQYEFSNKMYFNKPLEQNSSYVVFFRYFENKVNS